MTSDFRVVRVVKKSPPHIGRYMVKIIGDGRQVKKGQKTSDVIYGHSLWMFPKGYALNDEKRKTSRQSAADA